jgi:peptidoglycan/LPS O-acetylase OafA/YrhL
VTLDGRGTWLTVLKFNPVLRLPEFLMGVVLGRLFALEAPSRERTGSLMAPAAALLMLGVFAFSQHVPFPLMHNALLAPVYALLVYGLARGGGWLGGLLARAPMVRLGEASYSLYIFQYPVWLGVGALAVAAGPWVELSSPRVLFAVFLPVMIGVSLLCHRYVEAPLRARVRSALQPGGERSQRGAAAVSSGTPQA